MTNERCCLMGREISFLWNMIKRRGMLKSTDFISTPNLLWAPCVYTVYYIYVLCCFLQSILALNTHAWLLFVCFFFCTTLPPNIKYCIDVNKYSWSPVVIATLANAKLSHISENIMISVHVRVFFVCVCVDGRTFFSQLYSLKKSSHTLNNIWTRFNSIKKCEYVKTFSQCSQCVCSIIYGAYLIHRAMFCVCVCVGVFGCCSQYQYMQKKQH